MASSEDQAASERLATLIAKSTLGTTAVSARPTAPARRGVLEDEQSRDVATGDTPAPSVEMVEASPKPAPRVSTTAAPKTGPSVPAAVAGLALTDPRPAPSSAPAPAAAGGGRKPPVKGGAYSSATRQMMAMPLAGPVTLGRFLTGFTALVVLLGIAFMFSSRSDTSTQTEGPVTAVQTRPFQGVQMPVSAEAGPAQFDAATASGFAHTAEGAALAALHLTVRSDARTGPPVFEPLIQQQVTGDQATIAEMLTDRRAEYTKWATFKGVTDNAPVIFPGGYVQVGWKIPTWSETGPVTVHLLMEDPKTMTLQDLAPVVEWDANANDYKLVVASNRGYAPAMQVQPTDRASYTLFATE